MQKRSEEYIQRVVDMYNSGLETKEIAEKEGKTAEEIGVRMGLLLHVPLLYRNVVYYLSGY